jgi:hypothetical protein
MEGNMEGSGLAYTKVLVWHLGKNHEIPPKSGVLIYGSRFELRIF